jgi:hypothetical protein
LTPSAGLAAVSETGRVLGLVTRLDAQIPSIKRRDRGLSAGQLLVAIASCQLTGGDHLVSLDRRRADTAGQELEPVATPASRTAARLAQRFGPKHLAGIEAGIGRINARVLELAGQVRRSALTRRATIDIDATDVEVYGRTKRGAAYNYQGQRAYRPDIALWAGLGVPIAADLLAGNDDPRASVVKLIRRAHAGLPAGIEQVARTIPKSQLALALDGQIEFVYGYSFILTNLPVTNPDDPDGGVDPEILAETEHWYRHRTDIEALNKDGKHGAALRHMPSADPGINQVWMWAALLACAMSAWLQEITGIDRGNGRGRRTITRLRRELINIPARVIHTARTTVLRPPPGPNLLATVLPRLQALPSG